MGPSESRTRQKQTREGRGKGRERKKRNFTLARIVEFEQVTSTLQSGILISNEDKQEESPLQKRDPRSVTVRCSSVRTNVPEEWRKPIVQRASRQESSQAGFSFDSNRGQSGPGDAENTSQGALQYSCEALTCARVRN